MAIKILVFKIQHIEFYGIKKFPFSLTFDRYLKSERSKLFAFGEGIKLKSKLSCINIKKSYEE